MIKTKYLLIVVVALTFASFPARAQSKASFPLVVSVYNNASLLPGQATLGIFSTPIHPGISVGTEYSYNDHPRHHWAQTAHLGYFFHQYAQHGIQLYSEISYRYWFANGFHLGPQLGIGYLHSIPEAQVFSLNDEGVYERKTNWGRPQFMPGFALQLGYAFGEEYPVSVFMKYQLFMQLIFVNEYVPVLPNTALHLGVSFYPFKKGGN